MIIAAVDYSTKAEVWSLFRDTVLARIYEHAYSGHNDLAERLATLSTQPQRLLWELPSEVHNLLTPDYYAIEGYIAYYDKSGKMAGVHWDIRRRMALRDIPSLILPPSNWKREIGLSGNANKADVKEHILKLYPALPRSLLQDAYDAVGIGRAASRILASAPSRNAAR